MPAPPLPTPSGRLALPGFSLGHGSDTRGMTGVTVILCPEGAAAAAEVRGSATGTRQFDSLVDPRHVATRAHAVVLAGGSGFGLAAADPVVAHLAARGAGFRTGFGVVPLVPTAILFDLAFGEPAARPGPELVAAALAAAEALPPEAAAAAGVEVPVGSVGAGTGATVGKALGPERGMKGGFGFASLSVPGGPTVAAAVAVNAFGDVRDPATGRLVAGCRTAPDSLELAGAERELAALPPGFGHAWEGNTTLAVVMTDAALSRTAASKVCQMAFGGLYRALAPAISLYDGDLVVTLSRGETPAHPNQVGVLAAYAVERAIVRAVTEADGFGLLPAAKDLPAS
ncbi:MAG TPA: P1 family peptidase [Thermoanaerobaculia bacterium]